MTDDKRPAKRTAVQPGLLFQGMSGMRPQWLGGDVIAGATLAAVAIPEAMGYTKIAGMPVITGIYTVVLPLFVFAVLGSSRHLVVGADSATAAILFASISTLAIPMTQMYVAYVGVVAMLVAGFLLIARLLRLGFLADFLSRTALVGFLTGVGIQVALTQIPGMLGIHASGGAPSQVITVVRSLGNTHASDLLVAAVGVVVILLIDRFAHRVPAALVVVAASILVAYLGHLDQHGVAIVGKVQSGLPPFGLPKVGSWSHIASQLPVLSGVAASIFVVVLAQSAATSRSFAQKHDEELNENRDLIGLAAANLGAALSGTFVVNGSPTKTAVLDAAGQRSQIAQVVTACLTVIVLLVATVLLHWLPDATLGAVVFVIGVRLVDISHLRELWRLRRDEFAVAALTALVVLLVGVEQGIALAVILSVLDFVRRGYRPSDVIMIHSESPSRYLPQPAELGMETMAGALFYRFDSSLFFANSDHFRERVMALLRQAPHPVQWLVLDLSPVSDIDYTAGSMLITLFRELKQQKVMIALVHTEDIAPTLERYGLPAMVGKDHIYHGVHDAGDAVIRALASPAVIA